jgi:hypothetical protein
VDLGAPRVGHDLAGVAVLVAADLGVGSEAAARVGAGGADPAALTVRVPKLLELAERDQLGVDLLDAVLGGFEVPLLGVDEVAAFGLDAGEALLDEIELGLPLLFEAVNGGVGHGSSCGTRTNG